MNQEARFGGPDSVTINKDAPIVLAGEIEIAAEPELVWEVLSTIERWPRWNPEVQSASVEGPLVAGTRFRWKSGPSTLNSKLVSVAPPTQIAWTGRAIGLSVIHVYSLSPCDGKTLVRTAESVEGIPARLFRPPIKRRMDRAIETGLTALKAEAERKAAS